MKKVWGITLAILIASFLTSTASAELTRDQRVSDAQTLIAYFENGYAPAEWKKAFLDISMDDLAAKLMGVAYQENIPDEEFYAAMARYTGGLQDTHVSFKTPASQKSTLGFGCDYIEDKVVIEWINRDRHPREEFPYEIGDELLSVDGKSVKGIMEKLNPYIGNGQDKIQKRILAGYITFRSQLRFPIQPSGTVVVEIKSRISGETSTKSVEWHNYDDPFVKGQPATATLKSSFSSGPSNNTNSFRANFSDIEALAIEDKYPEFTLWNTFIERLKTKAYFTGIYKLDNFRIGYIRIPTFDISGKELEDWIVTILDEILLFETMTDALIIDVTNNGGGDVAQAHAIGRVMIQEPIADLTFQFKANHNELLWIKKWLDNCITNNNDNCDLPQQFYDAIKSAIESNQPLAQPQSYFSKDGMIWPLENESGGYHTYTKPLLILVNEASISAADMFPIALQDAGRAVVFGARTCGAGGSVRDSERLGYSDFAVRRTVSLAVRPKPVTLNGVTTNYLENIGVIPDVPYEVTMDDFLGGYIGYRNAVDNTLRDMLSK